MEKYVVGLIFSRDLRTVYLIRKNRPQWQEGFLNGVGGKLEAGETYPEAMQREASEECGLNTDDWTFLGVMYQYNSWHVGLYYTVLKGDFVPFTKTDEVIEAIPVENISPVNLSLLPNLATHINAAWANIWNKQKFTMSMIYGV